MTMHRIRIKTDEFSTYSNGLASVEDCAICVADDDEMMDLETVRTMLHQTVREEYALPCSC